MKYFIITGTSRGIGEGIAAALIGEGHKVIGISRTPNKNLPQLNFQEIDLSETDTLEEEFQKVFREIDFEKATGIFLINNAGILDPVKPLQKATGAEISKHIGVNVIAPMILCATFIRETAGLAITKRILNISSGAGKNPYFGWVAYCTSKAGIDMLSRTIFVEQKVAKNPVEIVSFAPGVVDTEMQTQIRGVDESDFINLPRFQEMHENGDLQDPAVVGKFIAEYIQSDRFENGGVVDIRDFD